MRFAVLVVLAACGPTEVTSPTDNLGGAGTGESFESDPYPVKRVRLEQTTGDNTLVAGLSLACSDPNGTKENSWYRIFALKDFGVDKPFQVNRVNFGVQTAIGEQRVKVSIGTYAGNAGSVELDTSKIDMLGLTTIAVPEGKLEMMQASFPSIAVPADANLVVEIKTEGRGDGAFFYLGATESPEVMPGYLRAPGCSTDRPLMTSALGYSQTHLLISVSGAY
ncbi:MAG TPA: hypothetical protein VMZ53_10770 [Kofleriaceae bacterium]|nr:hypothetical protein [Kofleriaceae bacterium]